MAVPKPALKYRILDPHVHVWANSPRYPWARETTEPPKDNETPSMLLDLMKANGVARTVLVQFIGYRWDNRYTLDSMRKHKPYFMAVCRVNPVDPAAPDQLSKLTEQGFHGVRLSPSADAGGDWIKGPLMPPLWKRAESLKVPMQIYASITRMPDLVPLIEQCPGLDVVIDHMAECPIDQPEATGEADCAGALSAGVCENLPHLVDFPAALSLAGCAGIREAPLCSLRSRAADVGNGLARLQKVDHLREDFGRGPGRHEVPQPERQELDPLQNRPARLAVPLITMY